MNTINKDMFLVYIDESYDETHFVYSAVFVNAFTWNQNFAEVLEWRKHWFEVHGIPVDYELHATNFVGSRGQFPNNKDKAFRADLFHEAIGRIENIREIRIINAITKNKKSRLKLFEYMLNRINRTLKAKNAIGILICDEGNENRLTGIVRKMKKENHIPNDAHYFFGGQRDIPLDRIIEDPLFKTSKSSYFIQLADFVAFSLLRYEKPLPQTQEKAKTAFDQLDKTLVKEASKKDPKNKGIVRCN